MPPHKIELAILAEAELRKLKTSEWMMLATGFEHQRKAMAVKAPSAHEYLETERKLLQQAEAAGYSGSVDDLVVGI